MVNPARLTWFTSGPHTSAVPGVQSRQGSVAFIEVIGRSSWAEGEFFRRARFGEEAGFVAFEQEGW